MRQTLPGILAMLAVIWIASAAVAAREGGVFANYMARQRQVGELRMLEELAARDSAKAKHAGRERGAPEQKPRTSRR